MDLVDRIREIAALIPKLTADNLVKTEEGVKNALVMPFIQALGYNVFNPLEVTPELIADVGTKKGEKVDYAIMQNGKPIVLFECKGFNADLNNAHASQLYRYFSVTEARFGILTNGTAYRFYTDLVASNKMDELPFFIFDIANYNDTHIETLKQFTKAVFDVEKNLNAASALKYRSVVRNYLEGVIAEPPDAYVKVVVKESKAYEGVVTQGVIAEFTGIIKDVFRIIIINQVDQRLKSALASSEAEAKPATTLEILEEEVAQPENKIITTQEELDAYFVLRAIVREVIDVKRVTMRDTQTYCNILIDDNKNKVLCRLYFNQAQKRIGIYTPERTEDKLAIASIEDIYQYADRFKVTAGYYVNHAKA
jgi:predicted type IV restriction endonuclease